MSISLNTVHVCLCRAIRSVGGENPPESHTEVKLLKLHAPLAGYRIVDSDVACGVLDLEIF